MFYRPGIDDHGLPHNPFKAMVTPRPIGWISSVGRDGGANLAPYSFFNALADAPPMVMFSNTGAKPDRDFGKDSVSNIRETGEFVHHIVGLGMRDAMNVSSGPFEREVDEFERAGLEKVLSELVAPPRIKGVPGAFECKLWKIIDLPGENNIMVIGEVVGIHIDEGCLKDGIFDVLSFSPLARLGYRDYAAVRELFSLNRPDQS